MTAPSPRRAAVLGALVADAAALGLHWLYDQDRVRELGGATPEFCDTSAADFEGYPAYFAHPTKRPGDVSQYGEQAITLLQSLAANNGRYVQRHYEDHFRAVFGYGGHYVGYIDHPTRDTLDNLARADAEAMAAAKALPFAGSASDQQALFTKVTANLALFEGDALREGIEAAVRRSQDDDETVAYALRLADTLVAAREHVGAEDEQLPAIAKLPALVAHLCEAPELTAAVDSAVRVTNNTAVAVEAGEVFSTFLRQALATGDMAAAFRAALTDGGETFTPLLESVQSRLADSAIDVVKDIGMSCQLVYGMPGAAHILLTAGSFSDAVRLNILAGGDSCGRAMCIGAVAGAVYGLGGDGGIPQAWIDRLNRRDEVLGLLDAVGL
ncbi:MAG: ADP-ribosylglycohydrolase family protein [Pseudomonadota bacterium]